MVIQIAHLILVMSRLVNILLFIMLYFFIVHIGNFALPSKGTNSTFLFSFRWCNICLHYIPHHTVIWAWTIDSISLQMVSQISQGR